MGAGSGSSWRSDSGEVLLSSDGQEEALVRPPLEVEIRKAAFPGAAGQTRGYDVLRCPEGKTVLGSGRPAVLVVQRPFADPGPDAVDLVLVQRSAVHRHPFADPSFDPHDEHALVRLVPNHDQAFRRTSDCRSSSGADALVCVTIAVTSGDGAGLIEERLHMTGRSSPPRSGRRYWMDCRRRSDRFIILAAGRRQEYNGDDPWEDA